MKVPASLVLTTDRLIIKQVAKEDLPFVFAASRYEGFNDGMMWDPPEKVEDMYPYLQGAFEAWEKGEGFAFSMWLKESTVFIGRISIRKNDWGEGWNVGYFTHPEHQGQGYMSEALKRVIAFGFEFLEAPSIEAYYATWNTASGRILEKAGMKLRSFVRQGFKKKGEWVSEFRVVITREAWEKMAV